MKIPLDAIDVSHANLDVIFVVKTGISIQGLALHEHAAYRVICLFPGLFVEKMDGFDNGTIEIAEQQFLSSLGFFVLRKISTGNIAKFKKT